MFKDLFDENILKYASEDPTEFYENIQYNFNKDIVPFFNELPANFINFFCDLNEILNKIEGNKSMILNENPLKTLLLNRFLLNPDLKKDLESNNFHNEKKFKISANFFKVFC